MSSHFGYPRLPLDQEQFHYRHLSILVLQEKGILLLRKRELVEHMLSIIPLIDLITILGLIGEDYDIINKEHVAIYLMTLDKLELFNICKSWSIHVLKNIPTIKYHRTERNDRLGVVFIIKNNKIFSIPFVPRYYTQCNITTKICTYKNHCCCLYKSDGSKQCRNRSCKTVYK